MLSNRIWIMPTADRSAAPGTATVYHRCGSQQGKPAIEVASGLGQPEFDRLTTEFVAREIEVYRKASKARQKNANRNLKKYFDDGDIRVIEEKAAESSVDQIAALLL
jgi:hypothetical protein